MLHFAAPTSAKLVWDLSLYILAFIIKSEYVFSCNQKEEKIKT